MLRRLVPLLRCVGEDRRFSGGDGGTGIYGVVSPKERSGASESERTSSGTGGVSFGDGAVGIGRAGTELMPGGESGEFRAMLELPEGERWIVV